MGRSSLQASALRAGESVISRHKDLNRQIFAFRHWLRDQPQSDPPPAAQGFYKLVFDPVEADLQWAEAQEVMVSLDGSLRYLPLGGTARWSPLDGRSLENTASRQRRSRTAAGYGQSGSTLGSARCQESTR
jgi:hypothetical protein